MILDEIAFRSLLGKGEKVEYVAHKHAFIVYPALFKILFLGVGVPLVLFYLFPPFFYFWLGWMAFGAFIMSYKLTQWYLDAWIITNYGVIDQQWTSFFNKATTRVDYQNIEGVSTDIKGFWNTILGYGDIQIQHMSSEPVVLEGVSKPRRVERILLLHQQSFMRQQNFSDHNKLKDLLSNLLRSSQN